MAQNELNEAKKQKFKDQASKQRGKIRGLKNIEIDKQNQEEQQLQDLQPDIDLNVDQIMNSRPQPLTAENLDQHSAIAASKKGPSTTASRKGGKKAQGKPAWARTEKQMEEDKEAEIDELLEFAYELDYEKYMDDYEVRQALAIIKDRVNEVTKETDWKEKMANEWNEANEAEVPRNKMMDDGDLKSRVSYCK